MNVFELVAKLTLDTKEYEETLDKAKSSEAQEKIKKGFLTTAAAGAAALGAFAVTSVKTGKEFDSAMSQVAATLGITTSDIENNVDGAGDKFDALRSKAREMGSATIYSAKEAAEGLNILAMSGYDATQSISMIEDVLHLAAAGSMDMASAAGYISGAMKGFQDETKDSEYYASLMAKGATLANTSVSQLGEALSSSAAVASSYNQTADTTTIALLRLAEQGEVGSAAGTALAAAMKNLYAPTDQANKKLKELGVQIYENGKQRDFNDVVNDLQAAMADLSPEVRTANAQLIFGIQGFNAYNKMVVTSTETQEKWTAALSDSSGEAARQYSTMTDNLEGDLASLSSAFSEAQIKLSDKLNPAIRTGTQFLTELLGNLDTIIPIVAGAATAFGVFAVAINIGNIVKNVTTAFTAFNAVLAANPVGIVIALLAGLAVALTELWKNNEEFRNNVMAAWESIKEAWNGMVEKLKAGAAELKQDWENIKASASALAETVKQTWENIKQAVMNVVQGAVQWGSQLISNISSGIRSGISTISSTVQNIGSTIRSGIQSVISGATSWGRDLMNNFIGGIKEKFAALRDAVSNAAQTVRNFLGFSEPKEGPLSNFHTYAPDMMSLFAKGITDNEHLIEDAFNDSLDLATPVTKSGSAKVSGSAGGYARELVLNITEMIDGSVLARNQYRYNLEEADRHGDRFVEAYA